MAGKIEKNKIIFQSRRKFISEERKNRRIIEPLISPVLECGVNINNSYGLSEIVKSLRVEAGPHDLFPLAPEPDFLEH